MIKTDEVSYEEFLSAVHWLASAVEIGLDDDTIQWAWHELMAMEKSIEEMIAGDA